MLRVLFVDDEPNILQGIRRATRDRRDEWEMYFAESGEAALAFLEEQQVDVVVSDMRMPGINGNQLLAEVKATSPGTARIILSGYAEEEAVFRATRVAHQFLSKPCDVDFLKLTIDLIRAARSAVGSERIETLVGRTTELPALGDVYVALMDALDLPTTTNQTLGEIVTSDVALTAELLRIVNSAFFGLARPVESAQQAIGFLGLDVVKAIAAAHALFDVDVNDLVDLKALNQTGQAVAALARTIRIHEGGTASEGGEAFLAGMLHEVGVLVLTGLDDVDRVDLRGVIGCDDVTNERLVLGADRYAIGGYLLGLWAFVPQVVEAVTALGQPVDSEATGLTWALRLAREISRAGWLTSDGLLPDEVDAGDLIDRLGTELRERGSIGAPVGAA